MSIVASSATGASKVTHHGAERGLDRFWRVLDRDAFRPSVTASRGTPRETHASAHDPARAARRGAFRRREWLPPWDRMAPARKSVRPPGAQHCAVFRSHPPPPCDSRSSFLSCPRTARQPLRGSRSPAYAASAPVTRDAPGAKGWEYGEHDLRAARKDRATPRVRPGFALPNHGDRDHDHDGRR